ncbi:MAG TPA: PstS family phosphate ABC transporter substrate-binding protein [Verrucomicrobiae bacterium]|nr:PstS family phosphate ABC transporter substrate-binding protein [Verrucomicrobiae bacterium]
MRKTALRNGLVAAIAAIAAGLAFAEAIQVDPGIAAYRKSGGVSGNLNSIGSDTLNNVMTLWAEGFQKQYPNVKIQIEGKGSGTAPPALIAGTSQLGPMSRLMKDTELDEFDRKYGYKPTPIRVALDGLAVYVNKDNPIEKLTLPEIDAIFSKSRNGGFGKDITTWGMLGLTGDWSSRPISLYGRNSASGTYGYFKEHALFKGDYKDTVKEQPGSAAVVQGVTEDAGGIGYSGIGYRTSGVKALKVATKEGSEYSEPTYATVESGKYPISRYLYVYVNRAPNKKLDPLVAEFLRYVLSKDGQEVVVKDGYLPLKAPVDAEETAKIQ